MTKTVVVTVATKAQVFPANTVDEGFTYELKQGDAVVASQHSEDASSTFADVAAGDYTAVVTKNGVSASADFSVAEDGVTLQVPDVVTVTFA